MTSHGRVRKRKWPDVELNSFRVHARDRLRKSPTTEVTLNSTAPFHSTRHVTASRDLLMLSSSGPVNDKRIMTTITHSRGSTSFLGP